MKVISIRQPWASLIVNGYKEYEFRNWKTKFRGNILIHASKGADKEYFKRFESLNLEYPTGVIIGSAKITDCIKVEKEFEDKLILENPLVYKDKEARSGYAFKLEDITKCNTFIKAKGQLGLWNYYNEFEVMDLMQDIEYGWMDKENNKHVDDESDFQSYQLQSPKEVIKNKIGLCWDQVELERFYFTGNDWQIKTYFLCYYDSDICPNHTFLVFEKEKQFYWFEHAFDKYKGIHGYNSLKDLLLDVKEKFIKTELQNKCDKSNLLLREYSKPNYNISSLEFFRHCEKNNSIDIDKL